MRLSTYLKVIIVAKKTKKNKLGKAMDRLRKELKNDDSYAHTWHCNLAMATYDSMSDDMDHNEKHACGNEAATRFMYNAFGVETSNDMLIKK
jgi:hypothetical protein